MTVDFDRFNFVYKPHPVSKQVIDDPRVITIPSGQFDALFVADVIISDYSTVIYEAGLLGIPVYLYAYDWATYREKRGLTIDFENDVPALFTGDPECNHESHRGQRFRHKSLPCFRKRQRHAAEKRVVHGDDLRSHHQCRNVLQEEFLSR